MKREMILPVLLSFGISLALGPVLIPFLRKVKAGQKRVCRATRKKREPRRWAA